VCPTGAIVVTRNTDEVWKQLYNPNKRIVVQIAPAVRVALGEEFGLKSGENVMGKTVAALRKLGFDEIYDTSMSADVTVMEESKEFLNRLEKGENLPLFTSCCPAWIRYAETKHPELLKNISTCRSPQQMFGSMVKEYYRQEEHNDGRETVSLSIMPCTAKKFEAQREEFVTEGERDVDYVLTTQELAWMFQEAGITFAELEPEAPDMPFGMASGAGVIFGVTGGVTEAVIRRVVKDKSSASLHNIGFTGVRGMSGIKETSIKLGERVLKIAVVSGLMNAENLIQKMQSGEAHYDFVEVMACPGGCISGAGQPFTLNEGKLNRAKGIYSTDKLSQIKRSQDNPMVASLYDGMLKDKAHELLHISYDGSKEDGSKGDGSKENGSKENGSKE
jgi:NADH-quinone oxidoreductase subunit G